MKYIDEFRNQRSAQRLKDLILQIFPKGKQIHLMEVCGTHTMAFFRYGLKSLLPEGLELISGPGCPVCVTPPAFIDRAIAYAKQRKVIVVTFGDMMRVPGSISSLEKERAGGGDVRVVYSILKALKIAKDNPQKRVVFLGIGFETTAPTTAVAILQAKKGGLKNFLVYCAHKLIPPAMEALMATDDADIQGFLCPGHVSTIIGSRPYQPIASQFKVPCCIAGFEPLDILEAIFMLLKQLANGKTKVEIQYRRAVKEGGNLKARRLMEEVFETCDSQWRGLGTIPQSGLNIREEFCQFDVLKNIPVKTGRPQEIKGCLCGQILTGRFKPGDCPMFAKDCTPEHPLGPCMVSSEGICAAHYKYGA